jgi:hypothetical protein
MRATTILLSTVFAFVAAPFADAAAKSCSSFAVITGYDAAASSVTLKVEKGRESKFFPRPEGAPNVSKIPKKCSSKIMKQAAFPVKATGGRLTITQVRENFSNKMKNDTDDKGWLGKEIEKLVAAKTKVLVVGRPPMGNKKGDYELTTIYLPITQAELDEIKRLENQVQDAD